MATKAKRKEWERLKAWGVNKRTLRYFIGCFRARLFNHDYLLKNRAPQRKDKGGRRSGSSTSRTGISCAKYGHGVKIKQNKQPFRTEDDIEARSDDICACNIPVRAFPGSVGSDTGAEGLMPTRRLRFLYQSYHLRERPLAGDIEKRAGMFTVLPMFS
jgi:hypothetical protein